MATISKEIRIDASADDVWEVIGDFATGPHRMAPGYVLTTEVDGDLRSVTFADGTVVQERLVSRDDDTRRIVYAVVESAHPPAHDNAVMQVLPDGADTCRFCWVRDILPDDLAPSFDDAMTRPLPVIKQALENERRRNRGVSQVRT
jgi:hypothetical protein